MVSGYSEARDYARRKPKIINKLVREKKFPELKAISQQYLNNAFDNVQLGMHNDHRIFGACPGEILHLIHIGWFRNVVDSFFIQITKDSVLAKKYDTLLRDINECLRQQSDRNVPSTSTKKGFPSIANIPGHEYAGCLFVMLILFYTSRFRDFFLKVSCLIESVGQGQGTVQPRFSERLENFGEFVAGGVACMVEATRDSAYVCGQVSVRHFTPDASSSVCCPLPYWWHEEQHNQDPSCSSHP
jgi:hypothetical protein